MSNFVRELVETNLNNSLIDTKKSISTLDRELKGLQSKIHDYINANYVEFLHDASNNDYLLSEGMHFICTYIYSRDGNHDSISIW